MNILDAMCLIEPLYKKILKINVKDDSFEIIKMDKSEVIFSTSFSEWWNEYAKNNNIHPDDKLNFKNFINTFTDKSTICYRRKVKDKWEWSYLEMLKCTDYTSMNPTYLLTIRDIDSMWGSLNINLKDEVTGFKNKTSFKEMIANIDYSCYVMLFQVLNNAHLPQAGSILQRSFNISDIYLVDDNILVFLLDQLDSQQLSIMIHKCKVLFDNAGIPVMTGASVHNKNKNIYDAIEDAKIDLIKKKKTHN